MATTGCANDRPPNKGIGKHRERLSRKGKVNPPTHKQKLFAKYYLGEAKGVATEAARLAGYGGSPENIRKRAYEVLHSPWVQKMIQEQVDKLQLKTEDVLEKLSAIAASEWDKFVKVRVNGKGEVIEAKIELRDVVRALELLGKFHKLFEARDGAISLVQFRQMTAQMGAAVVDVVNELSLDEETSNRLLESIEQRWKGITSSAPGGGGAPEPT